MHTANVRREASAMAHVVILITGLAVLIGSVPAVSAETMDDIIQELGLNEFQIMQIRMLFEGFARKQAGMQSPGNIAMNNRAQLKEVITGTPFDEQKAREVGQQVGALFAQKMVDRLQLRNQIFHVLTPDQQEKYIRMVQEAVADAQLIQ
jgi:Spy/CpxP family protein refolding chaperone